MVLAEPSLYDTVPYMADGGERQDRTYVRRFGQHEGPPPSPTMGLLHC